MPKYADVALPVAVDKTFTYLIPAELSASTIVGKRVIVPFGRKHATGLVVALPSSSPISRLKQLHSVIDAQPIVPDELMQLCKWIAEYYLTPIGEVLRAAIPHSFAPPGKLIVSALPATEEAIEKIRQRSPKRAELLLLLKNEGPLPIARLRKKVGWKSSNSALNEMARDGLISIEETVERPAAGLKTKVYIDLHAVDHALVEGLRDATPPRRKRLRQLLDAVMELSVQGVTEISVDDLLKKSGSSSLNVRLLAASGVLPTVQREIRRSQDYGIEEQTRSIVLNASQRCVLEPVTQSITAGTGGTFLLHGVTGSGKTQVYIEAIRVCLERNRGAIILVPEISLTPQMVRRFKSHFGDQVAVVHSRMSAGERRDVWLLARRGDCSVVIGPRSAVFAPVRNPGLIVVDEEHEASYKQYDANPRYHARDVAIVRGSLARATVLLGTATPSAESYFNATTGKYRLLTMPERVDNATLPEISIVDMITERKQAYIRLKAGLPQEGGAKLRSFQQPAISTLLKEKMLDRLSRREGIILLQNRRGFAPFIECPECGYIEMCDNCDVTLTYHLAKRHLRCHYCGLVRAPHSECPQCRGSSIEMRGIGTQRVEEELAALFPETKVLRMDLDTTTRKGSHDRLLKSFGNGEADILLGTQMVAKGLDFARVTLVGVISADTQMLLPDFRASERTFQLLTQVAGRAGRSTLHGEVIIQTHQPEHFTLHHVVDHDFDAFYQEELAARKELSYPPFSRLVLVETRGTEEGAVHREADRFASLIAKTGGTYTVLGPAPAVIARVNNQFRWHLILKSLRSEDPSGAILRQCLRNALQGFRRRSSQSTRTIIDVDPVGLL